MERVTTRGRPKGSRGRGGKAKRGRKRQIVSDEDENIETNANNVDEIQEDPVSENNVTQENPEILNATTETKMPSDEIAGNQGDVSISEEAEVNHDNDDEELELEAPSFTTMQRNVPQVMLRLNWDHKVNLIGEKVLNPMIYCCDQCEKPILVYGRMIPCKHVFCLACGRTEVMSKQCPRCKDKVVRVEQARLGTVFMCTHGGSRYGSAGCRRTYLSQRDLQAHINHRHVMVQPPVPDDIKNMTDKQLSTAPSVVIGIDQQQSPSNNLLLRKDSSTLLFPSRIANDNNHHHHQHSHTNQQQLTPTKKFISQDSGGFYNQQHNQFGSNSSGPSAQNNFFQQQSYHHQNFNNNSNNSMGHYSQQQGQHQQQNQHHQQPQWNQYYR